MDVKNLLLSLIPKKFQQDSKPQQKTKTEIETNIIEEATASPHELLEQYLRELCKKEFGWEDNAPEMDMIEKIKKIVGTRFPRMRKAIAKQIVEKTKEECQLLARKPFGEIEPFDRESFNSCTYDKKEEIIIGATWKVVHGYDMAI